jgi:hypothetical protein
MDECRAWKEFDMLVSSNGHRPGRPIWSDILQICLGFLLAAFLVQADRTISPREADGALSHTILSKHAIAMGVHMVGLEADHLVAVLSRAARATKDGNE